jgi:hypothetical protein
VRVRAALDAWEREVKQYVALRRLRVFRQHKLRKAFRNWKAAINAAKMAAAGAALARQLYLLSPVFQRPLQALRRLCHELSGTRLHALQAGRVRRGGALGRVARALTTLHHGVRVCVRRAFSPANERACPCVPRGRGAPSCRVQVYTLPQLAAAHAQQAEECARRFAEFNEAVYAVVEAACREDLIQLRQQLEGCSAGADDAGAAPAAAAATAAAAAAAAEPALAARPASPPVAGTAGGRAVTRAGAAARLKKTAPAAAGEQAAAQQVWRVLGGALCAHEHVQVPCRGVDQRRKTVCACHLQPHCAAAPPLQEYAYTMAAAYRSKQRRLLSFIRMCDAMMCDTLQSILLDSLSEVLLALMPSGGPADSAWRPGSSSGTVAAGGSSSGAASRSLRAMASMVHGSRRQRTTAAVSGVQLAPVTAAAQQASAAAAAAGGVVTASRVPLLELDVVLGDGCRELLLTPTPEQFQVRPCGCCSGPNGLLAWCQAAVHAAAHHPARRTRWHRRRCATSWRRSPRVPQAWAACCAPSS